MIDIVFGAHAYEPVDDDSGGGGGGKDGVDDSDDDAGRDPVWP